MKLILARVLPVALALLFPSLALAQDAQDQGQEKPVATHQAGHGHTAKRAKAAAKPHKAAKSKASKVKAAKSAKNPAKLSKKAAK